MPALRAAWATISSFTSCFTRLAFWIGLSFRFLAVGLLAQESTVGALVMGVPFTVAST